MNRLCSSSNKGPIKTMSTVHLGKLIKTLAKCRHNFNDLMILFQYEFKVLSLFVQGSDWASLVCNSTIFWWVYHVCYSTQQCSTSSRGSCQGTKLKGVFAKNERGGFKVKFFKKSDSIATNFTSMCYIYEEKIV